MQYIYAGELDDKQAQLANQLAMAQELRRNPVPQQQQRRTGIGAGLQALGTLFGSIAGQKQERDVLQQQDAASKQQSQILLNFLRQQMMEQRQQQAAGMGGQEPFGFGGATHFSGRQFQPNGRQHSGRQLNPYLPRGYGLGDESETL